MKTLLHIAAILALAVSPALADAKVKAGPRKGRILGSTEGRHSEFFVEKDRTVSIAFYGADKKQVAAPDDAAVTVIAEAPTGKKTLEFAKKGELLVSTTPLPDGEGYNVVVQAREKAGAKPTNYRIKLQTHICKGCSNPEYACTCDE